ncbi:MAG TPA: cysteine synthase family protein, partial [Terriglobales bacterium]
MSTAEALRLRVADDITQLVGETPMLHMRRLAPAGSADVFAKLEYMNPGGSIKDRAAVGMIRRAEKDGKLKAGSTIIEATAGNTGIGLALIGVNKGYRVIVCVPERFSEEKVKVMGALGAQVVRTPDAEGMEGAIVKAREIAAGIPNSFIALQFENLANPEFHEETTAHEIFEQMQGRIDAMVIGVGTGGTFSGVSHFLKKRIPHLLAVAVESEGSVLQGGAAAPHKVEGIGVSFVP